MMVNVDDVISEFKPKIEELYGERLKDIILYGSWARGEATSESDIDLVIVLKGDIIPGHEIDRMIDIITEVNLKYNTVLSVYPVGEISYEKVKSPLLINIRREGVVK